MGGCLFTEEGDDNYNTMNTNNEDTNTSSSPALLNTFTPVPLHRLPDKDNAA